MFAHEIASAVPNCTLFWVRVDHQTEPIAITRCVEN